MRLNVLLFALSTTAYLQAQTLLPFRHLTSGSSESSFSADRPGFGTSTDVLPLGVSQIESGFSLSIIRESLGYGKEVAIGSPLIRLGILPAVEFRIGADGMDYSSWQEHEALPQAKSLGWTDTSVGFKIALFQQTHWFPAVSLIPEISTPTGIRAFTSAAYDPSIGISWNLNVPKFSVSGTLTAKSVTNGSERFLERSSAFSISRYLGRQWSCYGEALVDSSKLNSSSTLWSFDGGTSRMIGRRLQIDVEAGKTLLPSGSSVFVATGISYRFPNTMRQMFRRFSPALPRAGN